MIFLDTNILLRFLTEPGDAATQRMHQVTRALFDDVRAGRVEVTTSEVVLHEACFVLHSSRQYGYPVDAIAPAIAAMISWDGFRLPALERQIFGRALEIWMEHPKLEFSDSVVAARCETEGYELATFDRHFGRVEGLALWSGGDAGGEGAG